MANQRIVLITGCSQGGLGDALAQAFHAASGMRVIATARNLSKVAHLEALGIETAKLDVVSQQSIEDCVMEVTKMTGGHLDILVNNSGAGYSMPMMDVSIQQAKELFDLNVWAVISVTQAFLPLIMKSTNGMVVNNTSIASVLGAPMMGIYNASKAAIASMTAAMRLELQPFGIKVIDLKTGSVKSGFFDNQNTTGTSAGVSLPANSIYTPAKADIEHILNGAKIENANVASDVWANGVVGDLLRPSPPSLIWRGGAALSNRLTPFMPQWMLDYVLRDMGGINLIEKRLKEQKPKAL